MKFLVKIATFPVKLVLDHHQINAKLVTIPESLHKQINKNKLEQEHVLQKIPSMNVKKQMPVPVKTSVQSVILLINVLLARILMSEQLIQMASVFV